MIVNKRILFVTDSCPPNLTMSGVVIKNIIDYLSVNNDFDIVALRQGDNDVYEYLGKRVHYIKSFPYYILSLRAKSNASKSVVLRCWYKVITLFFRICSIITRLISPVGLNIVTTQKLKMKLGHIFINEPYDYVICNAKPFESFEAVIPYINKYPNTKFIAYQTDDFATAEDERYMPEQMLKKKLRNRQSTLNYYIKSFCNYGMLESVYKKEKSFIIEKVKVKSMGIPLLMTQKFRTDCVNNIKDANYGDAIKLVFTGSLVKSFRPPDDTLELLCEVTRQTPIDVHIYQRGDCDDVIEKYQTASLGAIKNNGTVSTNEAYKAMKSADILISISNIAGDQISGKTFEYMSTGKPIIHFYYNNHDMNAEVIGKYELGLSIMLLNNDKKESIDRIVRFIKESSGKSVKKKVIEEKFRDYTVSAVVEKLFE